MGKSSFLLTENLNQCDSLLALLLTKSWLIAILPSLIPVDRAPDSVMVLTKTNYLFYLVRASVALLSRVQLVNLFTSDFQRCFLLPRDLFVFRFFCDDSLTS